MSCLHHGANFYSIVLVAVPSCCWSIFWLLMFPFRYSKRMCTTENLYHLSSIPYPDPSTWYSVKSFAGKDTVNRWDVQAENTRHCNNTFVDRSVPSHIMSGQNSLQGEVVHGPMAHPDQIPPICQVCGKGFGSKEQLLNHMMVHRNRKPHVCEICEKSFCSPGNLKTHIMIHTGQKPHSCEKCGKRFTTLGNLKTHSVVHTAEKPHACQVCGKGFTTLGNLKTHLLIHTGEADVFRCYAKYSSVALD